MAVADLYGTDGTLNESGAGDASRRCRPPKPLTQKPETRC
jgi:hypothetical protein